MREVASLSLVSGHDDRHPGAILAEERCPMVLHPPLAMTVVSSISSYLSSRHDKEVLLSYSQSCTGTVVEGRVSSIEMFVTLLTRRHSG